MSPREIHKKLNRFPNDHAASAKLLVLVSSVVSLNVDASVSSSSFLLDAWDSRLDAWLPPPLLFNFTLASVCSETLLTTGGVDSKLGSADSSDGCVAAGSVVDEDEATTKFAGLVIAPGPTAVSPGFWNTCT